jgi:serine protease
MLNHNPRKQAPNLHTEAHQSASSWLQSSPFDRPTQRAAQDHPTEHWSAPLSRWLHQHSGRNQVPAFQEENIAIAQATSHLEKLPSNSLVGDKLLTPEGNANSFIVNTRFLAGTLRADNFSLSSTDRRTVISGNGNVDFGNGSRDLLNLSNVSLNTATINLANQTGGVVFNPGNGNRVFDAIDFNNGQQILFEGVETIQFADGVINLSVSPNDPLFNQQWNLHMMGVHNAWRFTTGSSDVAIGVEDTGLTIDRNGSIHPELGPTLNIGAQVIDDKMNNHGTSVQGIIAARSNNGIGMSGINWKSSVLNIDTLGGETGDLGIADAAEAMINRARSTGKRLVINMSLGVSESFGVNYNDELEQVVQNNPDVLFVIAAGNDGHLGRSGISSPGFLAQSYSNVMAVGAAWGAQDYFGQATTPGDRIEYRDWWGSQYGKGLTVLGPSEVIAPTARVRGGEVAFDYTTRFNGTSAATPHVAGVASLVLSANPNLSAAQVREVIAQTAVDVGAVGYDALSGSGFVNADAAVRRAIAIGRGFA